MWLPYDPIRVSRIRSQNSGLQHCRCREEVRVPLIREMPASTPRSRPSRSVSRLCLCFRVVPYPRGTFIGRDFFTQHRHFCFAPLFGISGTRSNPQLCKQMSSANSGGLFCEVEATGISEHQISIFVLISFCCFKVDRDGNRKKRQMCPKILKN